MVGAESKFKPVVLIFAVITFFIFLTSFSIFYATENFSVACGCQLPPWVMVVSTASFGMFVGLIIYYIISKNFMKEKIKTEKNIMKILDVLDRNDAGILKELIQNGGTANQSTLASSLNLSKVKISRLVSKMETKGIIKKDKNGMTNKIILNDELRELFLD